MNQQRTLLVLPALKARCDERGAIVLTRKFLAGVLEYVAKWSGSVIVGMQVTTERDDNLDHVSVHRDDLPFQLILIDPCDAQRQTGELIDLADVVLASLVDRHISLSELCRRRGIPLVYNTEYNVKTRRQIIRAETRNPALRWRREMWTAQLERRYQQAVRLASGVQCNGLPTLAAYSAINDHSLLYFDSRVRRDQLTTPGLLQNRINEMLSGRPLRLGFAGRLNHMKGADHLLRVALELRRRSIPFTLDMCGDGPLTRSLEREVSNLQLNRQVRLRGVLEFHRELLPFMSQSIDLFVCCHRQGDPSCTYLETMSCGTPLIGYDNDAWRGLSALAHTGWISPLDDPERMAMRIASLERHRQVLAYAATASLAFASRHVFEDTMQWRVDHLEECCAAPRPRYLETVG